MTSTEYGPDSTITFTLRRRHAQALMHVAIGVSADLAGRDNLAEALEVLNAAWRDGSTAAGRLPTIGYRVERRTPTHTTVRVFVGRTPGSRGCVGVLTLSSDDLPVLAAAGWDEVGRASTQREDEQQ